MKRYDVRIDWEKQSSDYGFSADSALKLIQKAMENGATRIFVVEHGKGTFHDHPWR